MHVRCPHCHNAVDTAGDLELTSVACPTCGSAFNLVPETKTYQPRSRAIGHFQLLEQIGVGGFGTVWKARDTQLDRLVAIKIPRRDQVDPGDVEMFLREARAAAQLKHPGIVAVHEVGREDGTLYIVSDFVQGVTLADRLTAGPFTPREAVELLAEAADALEHAHAAGVIHRDLKPQNIMLDGSGRPHLMDFGLAKRAAGEITMTVEGKVLGTPAYMSPEQARGEGHAVDARTDVYSLGGILYELLTGERPFRGNMRMLLYQVIHDDPPSPRKLNSRVPRDLETIALKCLEKDSRRRYATAAEVAAELRRWLAGQPILARPIPGIERGWRWARRNPRAAAGVASLIMATAVLAAGVAIIGDKNRQLADKNAALATATEQTQQSAAQAESNAAAAREQSTLALQTLQSVIFDLQRGLEGVRGAQSVRQRLLTTALERLQQVSGKFESQAAIDRNAMVAMNDLGDVLLEIGDVRSEKGETATESAGKLYQRAFEIAERLAVAAPGDSVAARDLALAHFHLGDVASKRGLHDEALQRFQKYCEICAVLAAAKPASDDVLRDLSLGYDRLADEALSAGRAEQAVGHYQEALETDLRRAAAAPEDVKIQAWLATAHAGLGDALAKVGQLEGALEQHRACLAIRERLASNQPADIAAQRALSYSLYRLGELSQGAGQSPEAREYFRRDLELSEAIASRADADEQAIADLATSYSNLGKLSQQAGQVQPAVGYYEKALALRQRRSAAYPADQTIQKTLAAAYDQLGELQLQLGQTAEAIGFYQESLQVELRLAAVNPLDDDAQLRVYQSFHNLGDAHRQAKDFDSAINWYEQGLELLQRLERSEKLSDSDKSRIEAVQQLIEACLKAKTGKT